MHKLLEEVDETALMEMATRTLGKLVKSSAARASDIVDREVRRAVTWLDPRCFEGRRGETGRSDVFCVKDAAWTVALSPPRWGDRFSSPCPDQRRPAISLTLTRPVEPISPRLC